MGVDAGKAKKQKMLLGALLLVLLPLLIWNVVRQKRVAARRAQYRSHTQAVPVTTETSQTSLAPQVSPEKLLDMTKEEAAYTDISNYEKTLEWRRDPFSLALQGNTNLPTLQLKVSGIIYDPIRPEATYAIINEEVLRIGDSIQGIKVIDIQPNYVRLKKFNQVVILYLHVEE